MEPLVSIIVPVYRVEKFLRECLDSIVNQTYQNIEIILVDDGSPDLCPQICDEYARTDRRIRVIHQAHEGVAFARNIGLEAAHGKYIGFVDSDDWIEKDMFDYLVDGALHSGADITMCSFVAELRNGSKKVGYDAEHTMDTDTAMQELLKDHHTTNHTWNKLYKRELFDKIRFPEGHVFEDIAVMYKLYGQAKQIYVRPDVKYHYRTNPSGIMQSKEIGYKLDYWNAVNERFQYLNSHDAQYLELLAINMVGAIMEMWSIIWPLRDQLTLVQRTQIREMAMFAKANYMPALRRGTFGITGKLRICLTPYNKAWAFWMAHVLCMVCELRHGSAV